MLKYFLILVICIQTSAHASYFECSETIPKQENNILKCQNTTSNEEILTIVESLIFNQTEKLKAIDPTVELPEQGLFPNLKSSYQDGRIKIREFLNDEYYLKTMFKIDHIFKKNRIMFLDINERLYECAPPKSALIAILAHELSHLSDYRSKGFFGVAGLGIKMIFKKSRSRYERSTDLYAMKNGLSNGISDYRKWIYKKLDKDELKTKKCFYYTPEEINIFQLTGEDSMGSYFKNYCRRSRQKGTQSLVYQSDYPQDQSKQVLHN